MPIVNCPSCSTPLNVPEQMAGKKVKCPKCASVIDVPAGITGAPAAASPPPGPAASAPAGTPPATKSKKGLYIGLGVGAGVLLLGCCCLGIGIPSAIVIFSGESNAKVTKMNFNTLNENMSLSDIEKILGTGKPATMDVVKSAYGSKHKMELDKTLSQHQTAVNRNAEYYWRNKDETILVVFGGDPKLGGRAVVLIYANAGAGGITETRGFWPK